MVKLHPVGTNPTIFSPAFIFNYNNQKTNQKVNDYYLDQIESVEDGGDGVSIKEERLVEDKHVGSVPKQVEPLTSASNVILLLGQPFIYPRYCKFDSQSVGCCAHFLSIEQSV